jgi:hypothetical protein
MDKRQTDRIDRRLRETTTLGEASALVANDLVANLPPPSKPSVIVVEVCGGTLQEVYAEHPEEATVILVDHDDAAADPEQGARRVDVKSLDSLNSECKVIMFDAGICLAGAKGD